MCFICECVACVGLCVYLLSSMRSFYSICNMYLASQTTFPLSILVLQQMRTFIPYKFANMIVQILLILSHIHWIHEKATVWIELIWAIHKIWINSFGCEFTIGFKFTTHKNPVFDWCDEYVFNFICFKHIWRVHSLCDMNIAMYATKPNETDLTTEPKLGMCMSYLFPRSFQAEDVYRFHHG